MNSFKRSWIFTKNSWRVLKLDKELMTFPLISTLVTMVLLGTYFAVGLSTGIIDLRAEGESTGEAGNLPEMLLGLSFAILSLIVVNFYTGALIAAALKRFDGGDPNVKYGIGEAKKRFGSIVAYSAFSGSIGYIIQLIIERVPLGGKIVAWLFHAAWSVANIFSLPVIMTSNEYIGPIVAVRRSVGILKTTWKEATVANFGLGIISVLVVFGYASIAMTIITLSLAVPFLPLTIALLVAGIVGLLLLASGLSAMSGIVKAAIYHYAVTGKAPEQFDRELMEAAFTPKKARKIFG